MMNVAYKTAQQSPFERHRLGAVVVKGGRVLSTGYNALRYTKEIGKSTLHAEEAAILKLLKSRRQHLLVGADLYVSRVRPNGSCGLSRPCTRCMQLIRSVGIKRIYYSTDNSTEMMKCYE